MSVETAKLVALGSLLERTRLWGFLADTAQFYESSLRLLDEEGCALADTGDWPEAGERAEYPVTVLGRTVGTVLASPAKREDFRAAGTLARHVAELLGQLAVREYELNDLSQGLLDSYEEVNLFYGIAAALGAVHDVAGVCRVVLAKACEVIHVNRASILLLDETERDLYLAAAVGIAEAEQETVRVPAGRGVSGRVLMTRTPQLVDDVRNLPSGLLAGHEAYATRSFISVPLCVEPGGEGPARTPGVVLLREDAYLANRGDRAIGVINMTDKRDGENFTAGDLKLLTALACQAATLIENMRLADLEREMRIARRIQRSLLPQSPPDLPGVDVAGVFVPARKVGGDYYDFVKRGAGRELAVAVVDVSGHGMASALMMAVARTGLRSGIAAASGPADLLRNLDSLLFEDLTRADLFLSVFCCFFDPDSGRLRYANGGHPPAVILRAGSGECGFLDAEGMLVGVVPDAEYEERETVLSPGDQIVLYTDGVLEAADERGKRFGTAGLLQCVRRAATLPARGLAKSIVAEVMTFAGGAALRDDLTVVVLKAADSPSR